MQNITFDTASVSSITIGTTTGNPLLLTGNGLIQVTSAVVNPQAINAPLVLEGTGATYAFSNTSTTASYTPLQLRRRAIYRPAASGGTTTLLLSGTNTGANTISGAIGNGSSGATVALTVLGGNWSLTAANGYTGATLIGGGQLRIAGSGSIASTSGVSISDAGTLQLAGSVSGLANTVNVANNSILSNGLHVSSANQVVGTVTGTGNTVVDSGASLTAYQIRQNSLTINGTGKVTLTPSGSGSSTTPAAPDNINFSSNVNSLSIGGTLNAWTGTLDSGNNGLVIQYGGGTSIPMRPLPT